MLAQVENALEPRKGEWGVLADLAGVPHQWVRNLMSGRTVNPSIHYVECMWRVLHPGRKTINLG